MTEPGAPEPGAPAPLRFSVLTLFPELLRPFTEEALLGKAAQRGLLEFALLQLRDYAGNRHHKVDDTPYGGGAGMVLRVDVVERALAALPGPAPDEVILLSPAGERLTHGLAHALSQKRHLALLCGRYEGFDARVEGLVTREVSLGDFVLMGGEAAAACLLEAVARLRPGVIGDPESWRHDSFAGGLLDYPEYTRPHTWHGQPVPGVLLGGNHARIARWRRDAALRRTWERRPELLPAAPLDPKDGPALREAGASPEQLSAWGALPLTPKRRRPQERRKRMKVLVPHHPEFQIDYGPGVQAIPYRGDDSDFPEADGIVLDWPDAPTLRRLLAAPGLRWALTLTAGVNHVLPQLPPGVELYNASRLHDAAVAQHAAALILSGLRGLHRARDAQARREWRRPGPLHTLEGREVVVWGYGHIGRLLEGMLRPFGATVTGLNSRSDEGEIAAALGRADVLVLLLPATEATKGIVSAERLAQLKPGAWLANLGRGNLLDLGDLQAALDSGGLAGALLDVTDPEPLPAEHPLWAYENVVITPHVASSTQDVRARAAEFAVQTVRALAAGEDPGNRVDLDRGY